MGAIAFRTTKRGGGEMGYSSSACCQIHGDWRSREYLLMYGSAHQNLLHGPRPSSPRDIVTTLSYVEAVDGPLERSRISPWELTHGSSF